MKLQSALHPREFSAWHLDTICNLCCEQKSVFSLCANCRPKLLEHDRRMVTSATCHRCGSCQLSWSTQSAICILVFAFGVATRRVQSTTIHCRQKEKRSCRAERSCKPPGGGSASARQQLACRRTCLLSQSSHGALCRVLMFACRRSSQRACAIEVHNISSVGMCAVKYPCRVARCHQNALVLVVLSPTLM